MPLFNPSSSVGTWDSVNNRLGLANTNTVATGQTALSTGDYLVLGLGGVAASATNKTSIIFNNQGWAAAPSASGSTSNGDKLVFFNQAGNKNAIGLGDATNIWIQASGGDNNFLLSLYGATEVFRFTKWGGLGFGASTPTAFLHVAASTTATASIRIPSGTAPTSPNSGDMWYNGTNLQFRDGATTRTITWV